MKTALQASCRGRSCASLGYGLLGEMLGSPPPKEQHAVLRALLLLLVLLSPVSKEQTQGERRHLTPTSFAWVLTGKRKRMRAHVSSPKPFLMPLSLAFPRACHQDHVNSRNLGLMAGWPRRIPRGIPAHFRGCLLPTLYWWLSPSCAGRSQKRDSSSSEAAARGTH